MSAIESEAKVLELTRVCTRCNAAKPLKDFYREKKSRQGHFRICKVCQTTRQKAWRAANKTKEWERYTRSAYLRTYGITLEEYQALERKQHGLCAICNRAPDKRRLCVDHDHETGVIRGLLCRKCNVGLGAFKDSFDILRAALNYLQRNVHSQ